MNSLAHLTPLIRDHAAALLKPGVLAVRPGFRLHDGWPTRDPAVVVTVDRNAAMPHLPKQVGHFPVEIRRATPLEEFRFHDPARHARVAEHRVEFRAGAFPELRPGPTSGVDVAPFAPAAAAKPELPYTPPVGVNLVPVTGTFTVTCHASPDAGWPTLRAFLAGTRRTLTVGMYDFTSKHIADAVAADLKNKARMELVLDEPALNPTADQTDDETLQELAVALGAKLQAARALVRPNRDVDAWIYPSAYHLKVAVRDGAALWLSSGNWNNSNQPDIDPIGSPSDQDQAVAAKSDRDWHVIVEDAGLAGVFEVFLEHDYAVAQAHQTGSQRSAAGADVAGAGAVVPTLPTPAAAGTFQFHPPLRIEGETLTITPLLTPDPGVYTDAMLALLQSAAQKLYIQLQYIHPPNAGGDDRFGGLIDAVAGRITAGVDVRVIVSQYQTSNGWLERLGAAGVDLQRVKIQNGVHNKGFVVDGRKVVVGSQNWSGDGVLRNRDASVLIESATAAAYYEGLFLHDWERLATQNMA